MTEYFPSTNPTTVFKNSKLDSPKVNNVLTKSLDINDLCLIRERQMSIQRKKPKQFGILK